MSKASRILIAAIVAPLIPGIVIAAFSPKAALVAILYCYVAFLFLRLPTVFVLRRFGKLILVACSFRNRRWCGFVYLLQRRARQVARLTRINFIDHHNFHMGRSAWCIGGWLFWRWRRPAQLAFKSFSVWWQ
jgi:hypothetical protein